jgi:hypothetical protein
MIPLGDHAGPRPSAVITANILWDKHTRRTLEPCLKIGYDSLLTTNLLGPLQLKRHCYSFSISEHAFISLQVSKRKRL